MDDTSEEGLRFVVEMEDDGFVEVDSFVVAVVHDMDTWLPASAAYHLMTMTRVMAGMELTQDFVVVVAAVFVVASSTLQLY